MLKRRPLRPVVVLAAVVTVLSSGLPAQADTRHPTRGELQAAQNRVTDRPG